MTKGTKGRKGTKICLAVLCIPLVIENFNALYYRNTAVREYLKSSKIELHFYRPIAQI